jgi:hypothetical protein
MVTFCLILGYVLWIATALYGVHKLMNSEVSY